MIVSRAKSSLAALALWAGLLSGCSHVCCDKCPYPCPHAPAPLGTISDPVWQQQETNAEASDFVVYEHEFIGNTPQLNKAGEDHVKQIAARVGATPFPVLVEPSSMSPAPGTVHGFPVHNNPQLDQDRRALIVQALANMGVGDAETRVVIAPALTPGFEEFEAERAYHSGFSGFGGRRGFGGFFGGGFGGGFGGFGF